MSCALEKVLLGYERSLNMILNSLVESGMPYTHEMNIKKCSDSHKTARAFYQLLSRVVLLSPIASVEALCRRADVAGGSTPRTPSAISPPLKPIIVR